MGAHVAGFLGRCIPTWWLYIIQQPLCVVGHSLVAHVALLLSKQAIRRKNSGQLQVAMKNTQRIRAGNTKQLVNRWWQGKILSLQVLTIPNSWSIGGGNTTQLVNRWWQYQKAGQLVVTIMYKYLVNRCWQYQIVGQLVVAIPNSFSFGGGNDV